MCFSAELEGGCCCCCREEETPLLIAVPEGVVGRLQVWTIFVADGAEGVVGALIVVVGLGSWLGGPGGSPESSACECNATELCPPSIGERGFNLICV